VNIRLKIGTHPQVVYWGRVRKAPVVGQEVTIKARVVGAKWFKVTITEIKETAVGVLYFATL